MVLVLAHVFMDRTQSGLQHKSLPPALSMMTTSGWRTTLQYAQLGTLVPANQHELLHHAALFYHTFVVMTSDRIITLWERPRRAFRAADHTREPELLVADRFIGFSPIKMLFIAFRRGLFDSNFRSKFGK